MRAFLVRLVADACALAVATWAFAGIRQIDVGFSVVGFTTALAGALLIAVVNWVVSQLLPDPKKERR